MKTVKLLDSNMEKYQTAALKLFHSVEVMSGYQTVSLADLVKYGILPINNSGIVTELDERLAKLIVNTLGLKTAEWTTTLHKSWDKVENAPIEQLVAEQLIHYMGTYGMESLGLKAVNIIPVEKVLVDIDATPNFKAFTVVKVLTQEELRQEMVEFVQSVKAPHKDLIEHIKTLLHLVKDVDVDTIKSFEIKIMHCDINGLVPTDAQDFLRFAVYKATGGRITTLVKDAATVNYLKIFAISKAAVDMFMLANLTSLSKSFYRFKPLFLAFKANTILAPTINKIRRLAIKNHKPVSGHTVSNIMNLMKTNDYDVVVKILDKADVRELVKLITFVGYKLDSTERVYNIRNGKMYVPGEDKKNNPKTVKDLMWLNATCRDKLATYTQKSFKDMTFYIPEGIKYAIPTSEKQMLDVLPYGSKVFLPEDADSFVLAGHWTNDGTTRVDLDFHLCSVSGAVGWNSSYRNNEVLFSGDMTDAPLPFGAAEAFRLNADVSVPYNLSVNIFSDSSKVPFELLFAKNTKSQSFTPRDAQAACDPTKALAPQLHLHASNDGETLGYYYNRAFTVYGGGLGTRRVPNADLNVKALKATINRCDAMMDIVEFIELAGGKVIRQLDSEIKEFVDLSTGNLTVTTLFDVIDLKTDKLPVTIIE